MINYNRLGYKIKRDFTKFSTKISKGLKRPQQKFIHQMIYGILAEKKFEALSEIRDGSTGKITQGYLTIEAAVLSESGKMPFPVLEDSGAFIF